MTYGEAHNRFKAAGFTRFKGEIEYCGGRTWKIGGLILLDGTEIPNALVTYENHQTIVVDTDNNWTKSI